MKNWGETLATVGVISIADKLRADENQFRQVQLGILDASTFQQLSNQYAEDFQELVKSEVLPLSQSRSNE